MKSTNQTRASVAQGTALIPILITFITVSGCSSAVAPNGFASDASADATPLTAASAHPFFELPIDPSDSANESFGVNPFGFHIADHGSDGHPGFDFEFKPGSKAYVPADGTVSTIMADSYDPTTSTIQLEHQFEGKNYRTVYTNIKSVDPAIVKGAAVKQGQVLGTPGTVSRYQGGRTVQYGMVHFQVDDFSANYGLTNPSAVSPEGYFTEGAKAKLKELWNKAAYEQEACEPFLTNPRGMTDNPTITRTWVSTSASQSTPAKLEMSCASDGKSTKYTYRFLDGSGNATEQGSADVHVQPGGLTYVDFLPTSGTKTLAVYTILDASMSISFGSPGGARPDSLSAAAAYATTNP